MGKYTVKLLVPVPVTEWVSIKEWEGVEATGADSACLQIEKDITDYFGLYDGLYDLVAEKEEDGG